MNAKMSQDDAEHIALQALTFLAQDPALIGGFLSETGVGPHELKDQLQEPTFLGGVLDFFLSRSELLSRFAQDSNLKPQDILRVRLHFPGAQQETWVSQ
jgi:hypothetical protein